MRIAVVKLSSLGDILHALPAAAALQRELNAEIDWVCHPAFSSLVSTFTCVKKIIEYPRRSWWRSIGTYRKTICEHGPYDLVCDFQGLLKSAVATSMIPGKRKLLPSNFREGTRFLSWEKPSHFPGAVHAVEVCMDTVRHLGFPGDRIDFPVDFPVTALPGYGPFIGLAPWSRWGAKNWPVNRFVAAATELQKQLGGSILLLGGPDDVGAAIEMERAFSGDIPVYSLVGKIDMGELGSAISHLRILLTNDSGPMHLAAAAGTPQVAVFGPTNPAVTGPYSDQARVLQGEGIAFKTGRHEDYRGRDCTLIQQVTVSQVVDAALEMVT